MTVRSIQLDMISDLENYHPKYQGSSKRELETLTLPLAKQVSKRILEMVRQGIPLEIAESEAYRETMLLL